MAKKMKKKKKLKIIPFLIFLLIIGSVYFLVEHYLDTKIKNIVIQNNTYITDQSILEMANIDDYPSFYWTSKNSIKRRLLASPYIKDVKVEKKFYHKIVINVEEYAVLLKKESDGKIVLENKKELIPEENMSGIPRLMNYVPDTKYDTFIKKLLEVDETIRFKISEIQYVPNEFDKDRFLLFMDDGNSVYLTLTKFDMINRYPEVLPQLEGRKGILYLDSGNHFEIKE